MKKILPVLIALSATSAFAEPKVYGKINLTFEGTKVDDESTTVLRSNASRLGFKGAVDAYDGVKAIYQLEWQTAPDTGSSGGQTLTQRNIFLGLQGAFGTAKAGHFDTPMKVSQKKIDLFNDLIGDLGRSISFSEFRKGNQLNYSSPSFGPDLKASVSYIASEEADINPGFSGSFAWDNSDIGLYLAAALDHNIQTKTYNGMPLDGVNVLRFVGQYNFGAFQVGGLVERSTFKEETGIEDRSGVFASLKYSINDAWALKGQAGTSNQTVSSKDDKAKTMSIGADYKVNKQFKTFAFYTYNDGEASEYAKVSAGDYIGVGTELKF